MSNDYVEVFCFTSKDNKNIWAGVGSQTWAVSSSEDNYDMFKSKAQNQMNIGSFGLFYNVKEKVFTTPFVVKSKAEERVESEIWFDDYLLPFNIVTIGNPKKNINISQIKNILNENNINSNWNSIFFIGGKFSFVPSKLPKGVWEDILKLLM